MEDFLKIIGAANDSTRVLILAFIHTHGESCVCELEASLGMIQSRLSRHLKILKEGGFLDVERKGTWAYYNIDSKTALHQQILQEIIGLDVEIPKKINACEIKKEC